MPEMKQMDISYLGEPEIFFSDIVRIEANPETVSLTFGIKSNDGLSANLTHRAILTLPHFLRLAEVCNITAKDLMNRIENAQKRIK